MVVTAFIAAGTASTVLALSKQAWKLGISLSKLDQDTNVVNTTVKNLAREVKSLGNECDLVYSELEVVLSESETGSAPRYDIDGRMWNCLVTQVGETSRSMQELELFVESVREESNCISQAQRKLVKSEDEIASIRTKVRRHTDNLHTILLLINIILTYIAPCRADWRLARQLEKLRDMYEQLQRSLEANRLSLPVHTETPLIQCVRDVIVKGTAMYEASLAAKSVAGGQRAAAGKIRVAEWVRTLESMRRVQRRSDSSDIISAVPSINSKEEALTVVTSGSSAQHTVQKCRAVDPEGDDSDDDLETDLAKAALDTGTKAFEAQEWDEANSLLQEALRVLQQLSKQQRAFCDLFSLQYKLAVCAYHTQEPADAEEALMSLVQQSASSDEQRGCVYDVAHLLSHLHIRMGQVDRARSECEKALQARRRLLGKHSTASLESTALMAHIYVLLNNHARAKSCLAMIPEARRDAILKMVEESLRTNVEQPDSSSPLSGLISEDSDLAIKRIQSRLSTSALAPPMERRCYGPVPAMISPSPADSLQESYQRIASNKVVLEDLQSVTETSFSSADERSEWRATDREREDKDYPADPEAVGTAAALSLVELPVANETFKGRTLSRKEVLNNIGCQPKDHIEDAVCDGDYAAFTSLLNRNNKSWRSKLRKRGRPERVTALHFAALFGEIDMARQLLGSSYKINEVPYGYTTDLTPLKFAIGARQVGMVEFLIANGAKPSEPDSWSTLAGQLMNRSWLIKTMSEADKEYVPNRIIAIMEILLKHGWDVNAPFEKSGATVLHQAVTFWTGAYKWDLNLRAAMTSFLCERGADPFKANTEGKTPYNMALASGHQDLLLILSRGPTKREPDGGPADPVELASERL